LQKLDLKSDQPNTFTTKEVYDDVKTRHQVRYWSPSDERTLLADM